MSRHAPAPETPTRRGLIAGLAGWIATGSAGAAWARAAPRQNPSDVSTPLPPGVLQLLRGSGLPLGSFALEIRAMGAREPWLALDPQRPMLLASTAKLVTVMAALDLLGTDFRWVTEAYLDGELVDGTLQGDLVIVGGGDPLLTGAQLKAWLQAMRSAGLQRIRGDIVLDRSAFRLSENDHASTPEPGPDRPHHVRPDPLTIDEGVLQMSVRQAAGGVARLETAWPVAGLKTVGRLEGEGACETRVQWSEAQGQPQLRVDGSWGPRCGQRPLWLVPPSDADLFGRMVAGLWHSVGGRLTGRVRSGPLRRLRGDGLRLPLVDADGVPLQPWQRLPSPPLGEVIRIIDKQSHNLAARHLMLSLSPGFPARAASLEGARERMRDWLLSRGLAADELVLDNGSGLSRAERGSPRALTRLLVRAARRPTSLSFLESLPVAGQDGTLANRLERGAAAGKAFLKTGSLLDARALAGYVNAGSGTVYTIVVLLNHPQAASGQATLDRLVEWVARHG